MLNVYKVAFSIKIKAYFPCFSSLSSLALLASWFQLWTAALRVRLLHPEGLSWLQALPRPVRPALTWKMVRMIFEISWGLYAGITSEDMWAKMNPGGLWWSASLSDLCRHCTSPVVPWMLADVWSWWGGWALLQSLLPDPLRFALLSIHLVDWLSFSSLPQFWLWFPLHFALLLPLLPHFCFSAALNLVQKQQWQYEQWTWDVY